ncbi:hypothetical protein HHK36_026389 [Tetracentron sinense]|uniref:LisH domain-containing protein n=1 Tax=Tetracentron sinense TaxID=13715 RepID=A0A834YJJ6_TETSI|nr:hypothetical protein HHK36_026389 [Tetracentron sinense]
MAKPSTSDVSSDEDPSNDSISSEEEQKNEEIIEEEDEEELEAVARMAGSDDNESGEDNPPATDDDANGDAESDDEEEQVSFICRSDLFKDGVMSVAVVLFVDLVGDDDFCSGGSLYANPIDSSLLLSLGSHVDGAASTGAPVPPSRLTHLAESLKLEHQFLRVPLEYFKKLMRTNHRIVEKEMSAVFSSVSEAVDRDMSKEEAVHHLTTLVSRLQGLKRKLEEGSKTEHLQAQRCRIRLDHLDAVEPENLSEWNNTRMKRILVDYMLRLSYYDTAMKLAESNNLQVILLALIFGENLKHYYVRKSL